MVRSRIFPIKQPDETSCGPAALKMAMSILGKRASVSAMIALCKTNKNGTTTNKMISAIRTLGIPALILEKTTLRHVLASLKTAPSQKRAILVSYLYAKDMDPDSGHWAVVSSFKRSHGRIVLLDSYTGRKTSYDWLEFRKRWIDETLKRRWTSARKYRFIHRREKQLMIVLAREAEHLPKFTIPSRAYIHA